MREDCWGSGSPPFFLMFPFSDGCVLLNTACLRSVTTSAYPLDCVYLQSHEDPRTASEQAGITLAEIFSKTLHQNVPMTYHNNDIALFIHSAMMLIKARLIF